ncbi:hypothetical protein M9H77_31205 [Catharanthus roseus]|uniref:Uncharacterized protein n=1 Tax=Catharanthus roseus TaxID=4058 RepID=A0ACC0A1S1_CATRO|nr:hypothetical protein M9H77_31205 [Catharanthus roseus]
MPAAASSSTFSAAASASGISASSVVYCCAACAVNSISATADAAYCPRLLCDFLGSSALLFIAAQQLSFPLPNLMYNKFGQADNTECLSSPSTNSVSTTFNKSKTFFATGSGGSSRG